MVACPNAMEIWKLCCLDEEICSSPFTNNLQWLKPLLLKLDDDNFPLLMVLCREIWLRRNDRIFSGKDHSATVIVSCTKAWLADFRDAHTVRSVLRHLNAEATNDRTENS
ncbi:hypothetical protein CDL12_01463 [Handroanthus impetiginosus]|uniref:Uncharacterized protein n=1 Tax=Handroanthus impetiginosus TaxID=429701 RepID=A0A2G9I7R0_9LAMI|nr:hypothetical protein CDL12_01463 [Handroanthus impetiginosus]